jgi:IclR family transcriptional regulator, pca regulon regulatory protein
MTPSRDTDKEAFVTALSRGLAVIRAFDGAHPEMTLSEVAAATGLSPAVARRFLLTLVELGYAARHGTRFLLRPRILELGATYLESMNLAEAVQPHLQQLRDSTGDSASLTILDGVDIIHISHVATQRLMRFFVTSGTRVPAYVSSTGRVLLAHLDESTLDSYFAVAELRPRTENTVTSQEKLREILRQVRSDGYALVVDELDYGMLSIGVPVHDDSAVVAGVSCVAPTGITGNSEFVRSRLPELRRAAAQIARELRRFPTLARSVSP